METVLELTDGKYTTRYQVNHKTRRAQVFILHGDYAYRLSCSYVILCAMAKDIDRTKVRPPFVPNPDHPF